MIKQLKTLILTLRNDFPCMLNVSCMHSDGTDYYLTSTCLTYLKKIY